MLMEKKYKTYIKELGVSKEVSVNLDKVYALYLKTYHTGKINFTHFLDPESIAIGLSVLEADIDYLSFGGYQNAEYQIIGFYSEPDQLKETLFPITLLKIEYKPQFGQLAHKDVLGALMSLGIERWNIGDIILHEDYAHIFVLSSIADYILKNLNKVKRLGVKVSVDIFENAIQNTQDIESVTFSVSSLRLDSLLASAFNISRNKAMNFIKGGSVKCNYRTCLKSDYFLQVGDMISLRKYGRFYLDAELGFSKKGNMRLRGRKTK